MKKLYGITHDENKRFKNLFSKDIKNFKKAYISVSSTNDDDDDLIDLKQFADYIPSVNHKTDIFIDISLRIDDPQKYKETSPFVFSKIVKSIQSGQEYITVDYEENPFTYNENFNEEFCQIKNIFDEFVKSNSKQNCFFESDGYLKLINNKRPKSARSEFKKYIPKNMLDKLVNKKYKREYGNEYVFYVTRIKFLFRFETEQKKKSFLLKLKLAQ